MIGLFVIAMAQASSVQAATAPKVMRPLTASETNVFKNHVGKDMLDPDSAMWKMPKLILPPKGETIGYYCGAVNAKNAYGGYTGYTKFNGFYELVAGKAVPKLMSVTPEDSNAARMMRDIGFDRCKSEGYDLDSM